MSSRSVTIRGRTRLGVNSSNWSVFDGVRSIPPTPESLMAEIDAAIAALERDRSAASFSPRQISPSTTQSSSSPAISPAADHDARVAEEAYRAACGALAAGRPDAALRSLEVALESCPPDKPAAIHKLKSLVSVASAAQHRQI